VHVWWVQVLCEEGKATPEDGDFAAKYAPLSHYSHFQNTVNECSGLAEEYHQDTVQHAIMSVAKVSCVRLCCERLLCVAASSAVRSTLDLVQAVHTLANHQTGYDIAIIR
jgi:hypothetical protein